MALGSLSPASGLLPAPLAHAAPRQSFCFPTSSPLLWPSRPPCPRACLALSPPGPHPETGRPRHRLARSHRVPPQTTPLPLAAGRAGPQSLRRYRPEVRTWARAATWWCPEVGLRFSSGLGDPTPRSTARWDPGSPRGAGIPRRATVHGPGGVSNGQDGEASMMRKGNEARPGSPVLTFSRPSRQACDCSKASRSIVTLI